MKALAFLAGGAAGMYAGLYASHKTFGSFAPPSPLALAKHWANRP